MLASAMLPVLQDRLAGRGARLIHLRREQLDVTDREAVLSRINQEQPTTVLNCAAYTDVDGCETNGDRAEAVNAAGAGHLAEGCRVAGSLLVHYSTDFVFDGMSRTPYRPDDQCQPLSAYGRSKLHGEIAIRESGCRYLIVRTSWLYGPCGRNFVEAILGRVRAGGPLRVVNDQTGRPSYTADLADATWRLLDAGAGGVVHFANSGECSWHEFAREIVRISGCDLPVEPISSAELGRPARRPAYSVLDLADYERWTGHVSRHWKLALAEYLRMRIVGGDVV